jgi:hypothetical protein
MVRRLVGFDVQLLILALLTGLHLFLTVAVLMVSMGPLNFDMDTPPAPTVANRVADVLFVLISFPVVTLARELGETTRIRFFSSDLFFLINSVVWASLIYLAGRWLIDKMRDKLRRGSGRSLATPEGRHV